MPLVLRFLIPLAAGILASFYSDLSVSLTTIFIASAGCFVPLIFLKSSHHKLKNVWGALITLPLFFLIGIYIETNADQRNHSSYFENYVSRDSTTIFGITISGYPEITEKWVKSEIHVNSCNRQSTTGKSIIYLEKDSLSEQLQNGDQLILNAVFFPVSSPKNPHEFDYKTYLAHQQIYTQAFVKQGFWKKCGHQSGLLSSVLSIRKNCSDILDNSGLSVQNAAVAKALLLGDKEYISDDLMMSYSSSGTLHVLAVSGLHVGIIMLILNFLLQPVKRIKNGKYIFLALALSGIWFYTLLTGFTPSILRAAVMFSFVIIGKELQRDSTIQQSLLVSAFILIIIDPHILFQIGFLLSYLAVAGIVYFHPLIYNKLYFKQKWADKIWQLSSVSIAAQISTLPISIYCFHQFPNYFLFANLIVIPVSFVILILGIFALLVNAVPFLGDFSFYLLDKLIEFMNGSISVFDKMPFSVTKNLIIKWYDVLILYSVILFSYLSITKRSKQFLFTAAFTMSLFCISLWLNVHSNYSLNSITIYSSKGENRMDYFNQGTLISFKTSSEKSEEKKLSFHIYPNRQQTSFKTEPDTTIFLDLENALVEIENQKILFMSQHLADSVFTTGFPKTDYVYLYDISFLHSEFSEFLSEEKTPVILGDGVSYKLKNYLKKSNLQLVYHDLHQQGSITKSFY
ncbi:MAG: ComEC family competence protein [Crocinitomicaceae bacterium]|nr:ComEC family competence protein [Crocinitomicaceae bacterium]